MILGLGFDPAAGALIVERVGPAVIASTLFALLGWRVGAVDRSGAVAGFSVAVAIWFGLDWPGFALLVAFVALGTALTRIGYRSKARRGVAEARGGRRGAGNAVANGGVAAVCALAAVVAEPTPLFALAFCGALAAAAADTAESEIGQLWGGRPRLVTRWRAVPVGTDGAVSVVGTLAGVGVATAMAGIAHALGLVSGRGLVAVAAAGCAGSLADSLLGATLERRGWIGNHGVNALATGVGALVAVGLGCTLSL